MSAQIRVKGTVYPGSAGYTELTVQIASPAFPGSGAGVTVIHASYAMAITAQDARVLAGGLVAIADEADRLDGVTR